MSLRPVGIVLGKAREAPLQDVAHHAEVVTRRDAVVLDIELAIRVLLEAFRPGDDHRATGVRTLDMAVVVHLDAFRRLFEFEKVGKLPQQLCLSGRFGKPAVERFDRIALRLLDKAAKRAALRAFQGELACGFLLQGFCDQLRLRQIAVDKDLRRDGHILVELHQEAGEDLVQFFAADILREKGAMPPILPAADEKGLDADLIRLRRKRDDVGVLDALRGPGLTLDEGEGAQAIAVDGGQLIVLPLRRRAHGVAELALHGLRLAGEEGLRIVDELVVAGLVDLAHTWRRTAADLVKQAWPRAIVHVAVGAGAQQEHLLQGIQGAIDRSRACEGAEVNALAAPGTAMLSDLREVVILAQEDERETLVVAQQNIERGTKALDQLRLEQQRFGLRMRRHHRHLTRERHHPLQALRQVVELCVVGDAGAQAAGLADIEHRAVGIEHAVHAGARGQGLHDVADRGGTLFEIRGFLAPHRIGRLFL